MTFRTLFALAVASLVSTAATGCGSDDNTSTNSTVTDAGGNASTVTAAQACSDRAHASCTRLDSCGDTYIAQLYGTEADCEASDIDTCTRNLSAAGNGTTPAHTEACASAIPSWACSDIILDTNIPSACTQETGSVANGAACSTAGQCQSGFCAFNTTACGACAALPTAGQACTATNQCGPGLGCTTTKVCEPLSGAGGTCGTAQNCGDGLRCGSNGTCVAYDKAVGTGEACGLVGTENIACTDGTCEKGTCVARAAAGAACDLSVGPFCVPGTYCADGKCVTPACP